MASATETQAQDRADRLSAGELRERTRNLVEASPADVTQSDLAAEIRTYLEGLSVPQLLCLAYGHVWPVLVPGNDVPRGFRAVPDAERQGVYLITEACTRLITEPGRRKPSDYSCGTVRRSQTLPAGVFDRSHYRSYAYDGDSWEVRPENSRLTRLDFLDEIYRRMGTVLFAAGAQS